MAAFAFQVKRKRLQHHPCAVPIDSFRDSIKSFEGRSGRAKRYLNLFDRVTHGKLPVRTRLSFFHISLSYKLAFERPCKAIAPRESPPRHPDFDSFPTPRPALPQRHHSAPELILATCLDIIRACERELAVGTDAIGGECCRLRSHLISVAHESRGDIGGDQHASARVEREGPRMKSVRVHVLNKRRLAGTAVDRKYGDVVFPSEVNLLTLEIGHRVGSIGDIDIPPIRVHMHRSRELSGPEIARLGQSVLAENGLRIEAVVLQPEDVDLVLALERDVDPGLRRMKIEMSRSEAVTASRGDRRPVRELAVVETENLERARIFRLAGSGVVASRNENRRFAGRHYADLVREYPDIGRCPLLHLIANTPIAIDLEYGDAARIVVGDQRIGAKPVNTDVYRARSQRSRRSLWAKRACAWVYAQRAGAMLVARNTRAAVAPRHVENVG